MNEQYFQPEKHHQEPTFEANLSDFSELKEKPTLLERVQNSLIQGRRFHGTPYAFEEFVVPEYQNDPNCVSAIWLSDDPEFASNYAVQASMSSNRKRLKIKDIKANVRPVYVIANKIFDANEKISDDDLQKILNAHRATKRPYWKKRREWDETEEALSYWLRNQPKGGLVPADLILGALRNSNSSHVREILQTAGYDAFKPQRGLQANKQLYGNEIAVFSPEQLIPAWEVESAKKKEADKES